MANGHSWKGLAPSPTCAAATLRVRRRASRGPDCAAPGCWDAGTPPRGQGTAGGAGGSPGAEGVSAHVGNTGKGWCSGLPAEAETTGRSPYRRYRWGQAGVSRLSSPLLLSTITVVFSVSGPGTQSREEAPFVLTLVSAYHFYPSFPDWTRTPSASLPPPDPRRASLPSHIQSLPGPPPNTVTSSGVVAHPELTEACPPHLCQPTQLISSPPQGSLMTSGHQERKKGCRENLTVI